MATDKTPTHGERIEDLEAEAKKTKALLETIVEALASGDPTLIAQAVAK